MNLCWQQYITSRNGNQANLTRWEKRGILCLHVMAPFGFTLCYVTFWASRAWFTSQCPNVNQSRRLGKPISICYWKSFVPHIRKWDLENLDHMTTWSSDQTLKKHLSPTLGNAVLRVLNMMAKWPNHRNACMPHIRKQGLKSFRPHDQVTKL